MSNLNLIQQAMGLIHIIPVVCSHGELDDKKVDKLFAYFIWFVLMLCGVVFGYVLQSVAWGIGATAFFIIIGICIILWKKDTEKERLTKKEKENELD